MTAIYRQRPAISQRAYKRRGVMAFGLISVLLLVSLIGNWISPKVFLPIEKVKVVGNLVRLHPEQLTVAVSGLVGSGFFNVDVQQIKSQVESLPWVRAVSVRRIWPSSLELSIEEQHAVAAWNDGAYINEYGVLFKPVAGEAPVPVPVLQGPAQKYLEVYEKYRLMQTVLNEANLRIASATVDERLAVGLELDGGIRILIGRKLNTIDLEAELERFVFACHNGLAERLHRVELVDLRYTNGFSIKWKA